MAFPFIKEPRKTDARISHYSEGSFEGFKARPSDFIHVLVYIGNHVTVSFVLQQQEQDPTNLYLSNLPVSMDEQELENLLKPFGQVISTRILRDAHGMSRGVGFARSVCVYLSVVFRFSRVCI